MESSTGSEQASAGGAGSLELSEDFWRWMVYRATLWIAKPEFSPFYPFRWLSTQHDGAWYDVDFPQLKNAGYIAQNSSHSSHFPHLAEWVFTELGQRVLLPQVRAYAVLLKLRGETAR